MYVILGCGSVGFNAARLLKSREEDLLIIDRSKKRVEDLRDAGYTAVTGDMESLSDLREDLERASAYLLLSSNMEANLVGLKYLKSTWPHSFVIVRALDPVSAEAFEKAGADRVITPSDVIARSVLRELQRFEIQRTGDIFFPKRWMDATLSGHRSPAAAQTVRGFVDALPPAYPDRLRRIILSSADDLFRSARMK